MKLSTLDALSKRLRSLASLRCDRGLVVVVHADRERWSEIIDIAQSLPRREDGTLEGWAVYPQGDEPDELALATLNRERDLLLRCRRGVLLLADSPAALRTLREVAPDLTAAPDLWGELQAAAGAGSWTELEASVRELMIERHSHIDFTGLLPRSVEHQRAPLADLYVELLPPALRAPSRGGEGVIGESLDGASSETARAGGYLLLADPGAGKTTFLRHTAWRLATRSETPLPFGAALPLLVPLADYARHREREQVSSLVDYLPRWLEEAGVSGGSALLGHLGEVVLLLDGLDEMREAAARRTVLDEVGALTARRAVAGAVITGRSFLVDEVRAVDTRRFAALRLDPPDDGKIERLIRYLLAARGVEGAAARARRIHESVQSDRDLRELARSPLLLVFLVLLHELDGRLPDRRVEIYGRLSELLIERWVRARSLAAAPHQRRATAGQVMRVLGPLAWWILERGGGAVPASEMRAELVRIEGHREDGVDAMRQADELMSLLRYDSALLRSEPGDRWAFVHPSVAEFFAARDAERDPTRFAVILDDPYRAEWREVVAFLAGHLGVVSGATGRLDALVERALAGARRRGRYQARHPSLLVALLSEEPDLSRRHERALVQRLFEFWFATYFAPASTWRIQSEAVSFLRKPLRGRLRETVDAELRRWFIPAPSAEIRWDRLLEGMPMQGATESEFLARMDLVREVEKLTHYESPLGGPPVWVSLVARYREYVFGAAGPLASALPDILEARGIDTAALLSWFAHHKYWQLRHLVRARAGDYYPP